MKEQFEERFRGLRRRSFLKAMVSGLVASTVPWNRGFAVDSMAASNQVPQGKADVTLRIAPVLVEVDGEHTISTIGYNGQVPAPILRLREGKTITVGLINDTDTPEFVHWHGQIIPSDVDGAMEERSLIVPAHDQIHYQLTPGPAGSRWVHSHNSAGADLSRGSYTGQFGIVLIEGSHDPGDYDQEVFLSTHEWEPYFTGGEMEDEGSAPEDHELQEQGEAAEKALGKPNGWEVGYRLFTINGKALGHGDPVRVSQGKRVLFRILNASATENIELAFSGHRFRVIALDGNPVPSPREVATLRMGVGERIDAIVEMNNPGVWVLGTTRDDDRQNGFGIVVEYANKSGKPQWITPIKDWNYLLFAGDASVAKPDEIIPMEIGKINGGKGAFNHWTINGKRYEESSPIQLVRGRRYRLAMANKTDDAHPVHLHRHSFEVTRIHQKQTSGLIKDTVVMNPFSRVEVDFIANNPGPSLFHCHQMLHMEYGFMRLFEYV